MLGPIIELSVSPTGLTERKQKCKLCGDDTSVGEVDIPYILKYLVTQLTCCNINIQLSCTEKWRTIEYLTFLYICIYLFLLTFLKF